LEDGKVLKLVSPENGLVLKKFLRRIFDGRIVRRIIGDSNRWVVAGGYD
jgi:hypothetical protein